MNIISHIDTMTNTYRHVFSMCVYTLKNKEETVFVIKRSLADYELLPIIMRR